MKEIKRPMKETYERDLCQGPLKETYERDKETYERDL
jgi:hypothetical protein